MLIILKCLEVDGNTIEMNHMTMVLLIILLVVVFRLTDETGAYGTKDVEIMVPLKYLSNF